jgi:hypothetical protein
MTPRLLFALAAAALVAACGVKGAPELPGDRADNFPRTYPQGAVPNEVVLPGLFSPQRYPER